MGGDRAWVSCAGTTDSAQLSLGWQPSPGDGSGSSEERHLDALLSSLPLRSPFSPDHSPTLYAILSPDKELRTPLPLHSPFNSVEHLHALPRAGVCQVPGNLRWGNLSHISPRRAPRSPFRLLSGPIHTTDHVVSANPTPHVAPEASAWSEPPLRGPAFCACSWAARGLTVPPALAFPPTARQPVNAQARAWEVPVLLKRGPHLLPATEIPPTLSPSQPPRSPPGSAAARASSGWFPQPATVRDRPATGLARLSAVRGPGAQGPCAPGGDPRPWVPPPTPALGHRRAALADGWRPLPAASLPAGLGRTPSRPGTPFWPRGETERGGRACAFKALRPALWA